MGFTGQQTESDRQRWTEKSADGEKKVRERREKSWEKKEADEDEVDLLWAKCATHQPQR